jgi:hypothetical protein
MHSTGQAGRKREFDTVTYLSTLSSCTLNFNILYLIFQIHNIFYLTFSTSRISYYLPLSLLCLTCQPYECMYQLATTLLSCLPPPIPKPLSSLLLARFRSASHHSPLLFFPYAPVSMLDANYNPCQHPRNTDRSPAHSSRLYHLRDGLERGIGSRRSDVH